MSKRLISYPEFRDLGEKLRNQLIQMTVLDCADCRERLRLDILETIDNIIMFVKEEYKNDD